MVRIHAVWLLRTPVSPCRIVELIRETDLHVDTQPKGIDIQLILGRAIPL
jgi:hypothetical protein